MAAGERFDVFSLKLCSPCLFTIDIKRFSPAWYYDFFADEKDFAMSLVSQVENEIAVLSIHKCAVVICTMLVCFSANAGHIQFYEKRAQADLIGIIPDARGSRRSETVYNLKNTGGWDNDAVTSLRLLWVTPGTTIKLYNSPSGSQQSDWMHLVVKDWDDEIDIQHLEMTSSNNNLYDQIYYKHDGDLNGKVSRIEVIPAKPIDPPLEARLMLCMQELKDFRKAQGRAHEFQDQGSNYRQYFPSFTVKGDGSFNMNFKMNHIRGWTSDDYAIIDMGFDKNRVLQNTGGKITLDNISKGDDSLNLSDVVDKLPDSAKNSKYGIIASAAAALAESAYETGLMKSEKGGRENFPNVIESVMNDYGKAVVDCDDGRYRAATAIPSGSDDVIWSTPEIGASVQPSQGKYAYKIIFQEYFDKTGEFAKVVEGKTLACEGNTCRWGSNDSTPSVKGCSKYSRAFDGMKVSSYGYRNNNLSEKEIRKCND